MSEVDTRQPATRGRSSYRGGRGGFSRGGARGGRKLVNGSNKDGSAHNEDSFDEQGELGEMKKKYASELAMLKDMFPDWADVDLVFALHETDGDIPSTVDHITQGNVSQFAEVKSTKDRARSKVKESTGNVTGLSEKATARGGRGRGAFDTTRGTRGRGSERGRGGHRGGRGGHTGTAEGAGKDTAAASSVITTESPAWAGVGTAAKPAVGGETSVQETTKDTAAEGQSAWSNVVTADSTPTAASEGVKSSLIPDGGSKKSWASMFAPKPVVAVAKKPPTQQAPPADLVASAHAAANDQQSTSARAGDQTLSTSVLQQQADPLSKPEQPSIISEGDELTLTPSKVPLTEENVEHLPDESHPPATQTVVSNAGSADPRNLTPLPAQQPSLGRPPVGGYAASAYRATGAGMRSASFQRRVQEQQEAVVMPGHNAVDRAAVQFGSMGLSSEAGPDVDEDREEPETRHAPQHSPPALPRTSLPPAPRHTMAPQEVTEVLQPPKQAPGLPPAMHSNQQQLQEAAQNLGVSNDHSQMAQHYHQYSQYGQPGLQQDSHRKPYDPFSHQAQHGQYDQYGMQSQQIAHHQQPSHGGFGGLSSAPSDNSSLYATDQQRNAYHQYYGGSYAPQDLRNQVGQAQQQEGLGQQRSTSGFGAGPNDSAFTSQAQQQTQSRFGDASGSGHNTPNPIVAGGQQQQQAGTNAQSQQPIHQGSNHQQPYGPGHPNFPYGHPYYNSPYQQAYNNQFGYSHQLSGYGAGYGGKQSMYGSQGYGMGPQSSYDQHSSSPANAGAFGQGQQSSMRNASGVSGLGATMDEYGRASGQSQQQSTGFGGANDPFARSASGFGGQGNYGQQGATGQEESLKTLNDNKSGTSPALAQQGRPGSASNSATNASQSGLPPPQGQQSSFGGYAGFSNQGQYGGLGGLGAQQPGQNSMGGQGYGSYGAGGFGQTYGGYSSRGGWGSNYGAH